MLDQSFLYRDEKYGIRLRLLFLFPASFYPMQIIFEILHIFHRRLG